VELQRVVFVHALPSNPSPSDPFCHYSPRNRLLKQYSPKAVTTQVHQKKLQENMENGAPNHGVDTGSTITIKGILSLLMETIDENNDKRVISLGMGDPSAYSCFHTTHVAEQAVVDAIQSEKFNGYAPTVGLYQTRR
jgi:hypothetical protein